MRIRLPLIAGLALFAASASYAGTGGGQNMAGCGLGSMIFQDNNNTKGAQSTAATTNGTFYNMYFGITSGTLGCSSEGLWAKRQQEVFVATNFRNLSRELATGEGEYARSFAEVMGCGSDAASFLDYTKQNHGEIFSSEKTTPAEALEAVRDGISADANLSSVCTL